MMAALLSSFKYALRSLRKSPAFALTVIVSLGIGIGLNAAIFTVVDNVLLKPLGYHDADRIVAIQTHFNDEGRSIPRLGGDDYVDLSRDVKGLESTAFYQADDDGMQVNGAAVYAPMANVSPRFLDILDVQPVAGRLFDPQAQQGSDAVISAAFAREHFVSAQAALGQVIKHSAFTYSIVGVLPDGFGFPGKTSAWLEQSATPRWLHRTSYNDRVIAKRRVGVSAAALSAELVNFSARLQKAFPEDRHKSIEAISLQDQVVGKLRPTLNLLMGSVAVILLIVCANVTHLQLVRATRELRGVTIRTALGASRGTLAIRALAEAMLLALGGAMLALALAFPTLQLLLRLAPVRTPRLAEVHLNADVLAFSVLISMLVMVVTALLPVWRSWHVDPALALRTDATRGTESRGSARLRNSFIVAEVALTLTLSVAAVLLTRQLIAQSHQALGFTAEQLITLDTHAILPAAAPVAKDTSAAAKAQLAAEQTALNESNVRRLEAAVQSVSTVPGVQQAAAIMGAPMGFGGSDVLYAIDGKQQLTDDGAGMPNAQLRVVTNELFATLQIPVLRGRALSAEDLPTGMKVVLINQALARSQFGQENPLGKTLHAGYDGPATIPWTIVGVVADVRDFSPAVAALPTLYLPLAQHPGPATDMQIVVRSAAGSPALAEALRRRLASTHPELAVKATTMTQNVGDVQQTEHFRTTLFSLFAAVSILLAALGMYGVTAYTVAQRRFEFGLRVALGANRRQLLTMVLRGALSVAALGVGIGVVLSLGLQRVLGSVIGALPAFDAVAYGLASAGVLVIALLATLLPARRAAGVDPMTVLRSD